MQCRISAADDEHLFIFKKGSVADGTEGNAGAHQLGFAGHAQKPVFGSCSENQRSSLVVGKFAVQQLIVSFVLCGEYGVDFHFGSQV